MRKKYLDSRWFKKYRKVARIQVIDLLVGDPKKRLAMKQDFLDGKIRNPVLDYPKIAKINTDGAIAYLKNLGKEIKEKEHNKVVAKAYKAVIKEKIVHLELLKCIQNGDDKCFKKKTEQAFGKPQREVLERLMPQINSMIKQAKQSGRKDLKEAINHLNSHLRKIKANPKEAISTKFFPKIQGLTTHKEIRDRFNRALKEYGLRGWKVQLEKKGFYTFVSVNPAKKIIRLPITRQLSRQHMEALVAHEIGVHARRAQNAQASNFKLLSIGLDNYLKGEEGLSKMQELKVYPRALNSTAQIYLGICLVYGMSGEKFDFRHTFDFFKYYYKVSRFERGITNKAAEDYAWMRASKFFRGTTGQSKGICFTKDLIYMHGYVDIVELLKKNPEETGRFFLGKYDPANIEHRKILDELGIVS